MDTPLHVNVVYELPLNQPTTRADGVENLSLMMPKISFEIFLKSNTNTSSLDKLNYVSNRQSNKVRFILKYLEFKYKSPVPTDFYKVWFLGKSRV